jgi:hypothetical protein
MRWAFSLINSFVLAGNRLPVVTVPVLEKHHRIKHTPLPMTQILLSCRIPRDQMQNCFFALTPKYAALCRPETGHDIGFFGVKINNLSLALVSPLSAYDSNIGHDLFPTFNGLDRNNIRQLWQYHDAIASRCRMDI